MISHISGSQYRGSDQRFWKFVDIRGPHECWPWMGGKCSSGYGTFRDFDNRVEQSHRVAFRLDGGILADFDLIRHSCFNRPCCNPVHLVGGSHSNNQLDYDRVLKRRGDFMRRILDGSGVYAGYSGYYAMIKVEQTNVRFSGYCSKEEATQINKVARQKLLDLFEDGVDIFTDPKPILYSIRQELGYVSQRDK